jgi:hypothetical protein
MFMLLYLELKIGRDSAIFEKIGREYGAGAYPRAVDISL